MHTALHQSQYQAVLDFDTLAFSPENKLPARILQIRAQLALGQYDDIASSISASDASSTPDLHAAKLTAQYLSSGDESALASAQELASAHADNSNVQILISTLLAHAGDYDAALALLSSGSGSGSGSLDAVALTIQLHLLQNRPDLAAKEARSARSFAQDALLVNLAESWVGMRVGGEQAYQQAFYVFEELAQSPSQTSTRSLVAQAVSEMHLQRWPEAEVALATAMERDSAAADVDAVANAVALYTILGDDAKVGELKAKLSAEHDMMKGLLEKREAFELACAKYSPKFEP